VKKTSFLMLEGKIVLWLRDRVCEDAEDLLASEQFKKLLNRCIDELQKKNSKLLQIFGHSEISDSDQEKLLTALHFLTRLPAEHVVKLVENSETFFYDKTLLNSFVEYLYNYWRHFQRLIISQANGDEDDVNPNRTFNRTIEHLTSLVRSTYRDIQVNITSKYPRIYRQVSAGAEIAAITKIKNLNIPAEYKEKVENINLIRQVLIYPPLIFNSTCNKRSRFYERIAINPITFVNPNADRWLCYPAMVGALLILVYFPIELFELNISLCNLFELASGIDLNKKPDAMIFFGAAQTDLPKDLWNKSFFYDDDENHLLVGVVPDNLDFGYFGYLKKLILTLHNIKVMKMGRLPFHGALFQLKLSNTPEKNILIIGDTGAGKSETLESFRSIASKEIEDVTIISDDMGSLEINKNNEVIGYGTEIGAFIRLDDLQPGYAFGQMDRAVIMNASQVNARVVIPVTTYDTIMKGYRVDYVFYANNYDNIDEGHNPIRQFGEVDDALSVFRSGRVMSKGTTTTTGIIETYFANIFGPYQYQNLHEDLAKKYFNKLFENKVFVGELLTQLGIEGQERNGPMNAAKELLKLLKQ
jgi:energy-coupling factor transporter ATP-binding protein EcfA2